MASLYPGGGAAAKTCLPESGILPQVAHKECSNPTGWRCQGMHVRSWTSVSTHLDSL